MEAAGWYSHKRAIELLHCTAAVVLTAQREMKELLADLEMLAVWQEVASCLPVDGVVLQAGVDTVDGDMEEPGEHVGDGVLPPVVLPAHPVHTLTGPALLVHSPDTELPAATTH